MPTDLIRHIQHFQQHNPSVVRFFDTQDQEDHEAVDGEQFYNHLKYSEKWHTFCQVEAGDKSNFWRWRYKQNYQLSFGLALPIGVAVLGAALAEEGPRSMQANLDGHTDAEWEAFLAEFAIILGCWLVLFDLPWFLSVAWPTHSAISELSTLRTYDYKGGKVLLSPEAVQATTTWKNRCEYRVTAYSVGGDGAQVVGIPFYARVSHDPKTLQFRYPDNLEKERYDSIARTRIAGHQGFQSCCFVPLSDVTGGSADVWDHRKIRFSERRDGDLFDGFYSPDQRRTHLSLEQYCSIFDQLEAVVGQFHQDTGHGVMDLKMDNILFSWDPTAPAGIRLYLHDVANCKIVDSNGALTSAVFSVSTMAPHTLVSKQPPDMNELTRDDCVQTMTGRLLFQMPYNRLCEERRELEDSNSSIVAQHERNIPMSLTPEQQFAHDKWGIGMIMLDLMLADREWWVESGEKAGRRQEMLGRIQGLLKESEQYMPGVSRKESKYAM